jgi:predicted nucleotidyltransferase
MYDEARGFEGPGPRRTSIDRDASPTFQKDTPVSRTTIAIDRERLGALCRRHGIRRLALFGSALRDDFRADSDIDLLVEFEPGKTPGLAFFGIQDELAAFLGRKVDLNTVECLSRYFRDDVRRFAEVLYDAG